MKEKKNSERFLYNPMLMTAALKELGEEYDRKSTFLFYSVVFFIALYLGVFFELKVNYLLIVIGVYLLCVPQLIYNQKKQAFELRRFQDVNAYMGQMAQMFVEKNEIIVALEDTCRSFSKGRMADTLNKACEITECGISDIRRAEREAFEHIEEKYNCEKIKNLHAFLCVAEERGGECSSEFDILEKIRIAWRNAVFTYHRNMVKKRNVGIGAYGALLFICVLILNMLRKSDVDLFTMEIVQITNTFLLCAFVIYFTILDKRLNTSLLKDAKNMSEESVKRNFDYIKNFDSKKERRKYLVYGVLSIIAAVLTVVQYQTMISLAIAVGIIFVGFNIHKIVLLMTVHSVKREVKKEFPKWLFDVMLLIQRESVEGAIEKSISKASPILKNELARIIKLLNDTPHNADAYTSFFADFKFSDVEEAMRKLYGLAIGTGDNKNVMSVIIEENMVILENAEKESLEIRSSLDVSSMTPIMIVGMGMMLYVIALFINVLGYIGMMF